MGLLDELSAEELQPLKDARSIMYQVYGDALELDIYDNEHYGNPYRLSNPFSISREGDEPAGVTAFMGMRFIYDKRMMKVAQAVDGAVIASARGKGHFSNSFRSFEERDKEDEFILGLPNNQSYPKLLHYGYNKAVWLCHYIFPTAPWSFVFGKNSVTKVLDKGWKTLFLFKGCQVQDSEELELFPVGNYRDLDPNNLKKELKKLMVPISDKEISRLWAESKCHFLHDASIYRWKFSYNPDLEFFWSVLRDRRGILKGYALCHLRKKAKGHMVIIDDYYLMGDEEEKIRICKLLFSKFTDLGGLLEVPFVNDECGDGAFLKKLRFFNATKIPFGLRGGPLIVSENCRYSRQMTNLEFRNIDSDVL